MSSQAREKIIYKEEEYLILDEPLYIFLKEKGIKFEAFSSACYKGYYGKWELKDSKLYLIDFEGNTEFHKRVQIDYLFPNQTEVFASWFSGNFKICKYIDYVDEFGDENKNEIELTFENGVLVEDALFEKRNTNISKSTIPISKNSWLNPTDGLGKMENGVVDQSN